MTSAESLLSWLAEKLVEMGMQMCWPLLSGQHFLSHALAKAKAASCIDVAWNQIKKDILRLSRGEKL